MLRRGGGTSLTLFLIFTNNDELRVMALSTQKHQCQLYVFFAIALETFRLDSLKSKRRKSMSFWENWGGKVRLTIFSMSTNVAPSLHDKYENDQNHRLM